METLWALKTRFEEEPGMEIIGEASEADALLKLARATLVDLILMDGELPGRPIEMLIADLHKLVPKPKIVVMSSNPEYGRKYLKAGADAHVAKLVIDLPMDDTLIAGNDAPLAQKYRLPNGFVVGNRFCVLPMEGWDGERDGRPSELSLRRWQHFGQSGAKFIWGGEAVAVRHDGRANPNQLTAQPEFLQEFIQLRERLAAAHQASFGNVDDLFIGLQLTHSGRFCRPNDKKKLELMILYRHPVLDRKFGVPDFPLLRDDEIAGLIDDFIVAAKLAQRAGFHFVDLKHCHGYLGHEFLSAIDRPGKYGGSFENRTRFVRELVAGIRANAPSLEIGVRLSAFDFVPFRPGVNNIGEPEPFENPYRHAFGGDGTGLGIDLTEPKQFRDLSARAHLTEVQALADSVRRGATLANSLWIAQGRPVTLEVRGARLRMVNGYPASGDIAHLLEPGEGMGFVQAGGDWRHLDSRADSTCGVSYAPPERNAQPPLVRLRTRGC